jgi:zinc protease
LKKIDKLDRKTPPPIHEVTSLTLPYPSVTQLDNGIPVYETRSGTQEIMKIEVVFLSGRPHEHKRLVSRSTARMLREGTKSYNAAELAEQVDFYAGTLQTPVNLDTGGIVLYCMTKHFPKLAPILAEILLEPTFPEKELTTYTENNIQSLLVELSKNDVLAYRKITEIIFGENHPYGYNSTPDDYRALTRVDLIKHHQEHFTSDNCLIFLSGKTDDSILKLLNQYLGQQKTIDCFVPRKDIPLSISTQKPQKIKVKNADTLQTAIRIGRQFGNRNNPDFNGFFVLNTIFGGYFSSRLMTNIREKKGYTYNIYSALDLMHRDGYFYISSEVGNRFVKKALTEIYIEMEKMQNEPVSAEELKMVQNYLLGNMLNMVDGPFAVSDVVKSFITEGVDLSHFQLFVEKIRSITPQEIQALAQKYFKREDMFEVIVGV